MQGDKDGGVVMVGVALALLGGKKLRVKYLLDINGILGSVVGND